MLVTGIILAPAAIATPAVQDLVNLRAVINAAASTIGDQNNPNRGFGLGLFGGSDNQMGTANLVQNITMTILQSKFQLDTNKTSWLLPANMTNTTNLNNVIPSPTLPLTSSMANPSIIPTTTPTLDNITTDLSTPYIDYVSSIPNLGTSLTSLGRAYHKEMNSPIYVAITALQQAISAFQSTALQSNLINTQAILRAIRANSALGDAQQAWSRFLNLPGPGGAAGNSDDGSGSGSGAGSSGVLVKKRDTPPETRLPPTEGKFYTHKELWGRKEPRVMQLRGGKYVSARAYDAVVGWEEQRERTAEHARVGHPYAA